MSKRSWKGLIVLGLIAALLLAACASSDSGAAEPDNSAIENAEAAQREAEAAVAAAEAKAAEAEAQAALAQAEAEGAAAAVAAAEAKAAEAEAQAALAQAEAEGSKDEIARAQEALEEAQMEADIAEARAYDAERYAQEAEREVLAAEMARLQAQEAEREAQAAAEMARDRSAMSLDRVVISTPSLVAQADYARAPYVAPAHAAGLLAFGGYLFRYEADGSFVPDLAEDFPEFSDDRLTMTVTLRDGLVYSDGTPVVAQDAVVTLERAKAEGPFGAQMASLDYAEAPDDRTIVYHLNEPFDCRTQKIVCSEQLPIHPHEQVLADPEEYFTKPVSASQYMVSEWAPGSPTMVLEANPNYWQGPPAIQTLVLASATDAISRLLQVTTGDAAVGFDIPVSVRADLPPEVNQVVHPIGGTFWFVTRSDSPGPLADVRVRKAMCMVADRFAINERAFLGTAEPVGSILSKHRTEWVYEDIIPLERDVEGAKALLEEAGYGDGFSIPLQTWGARPGWTDAATVLAENLAEIGITAEVQPVEDAVAIDNIINRNYDVMWVGSGGDNFSTLRTLFYTNNFWSNSVAFSDAEVDGLMDTLAVAMATGQLDEAQQLQTEVQSVALDKSANYCPTGERAVLVGSRLPADVLSMIPASQNFWIGKAEG